MTTSTVGSRKGDATWEDKALCSKVPREKFFPRKGNQAKAAKKVCADCPVTAECLAAALARKEPVGVWGGKSTSERQRILRSRTA